LGGGGSTFGGEVQQSPPTPGGLIWQEKIRTQGGGTRPAPRPVASWIQITKGSRFQFFVRAGGHSPVGGGTMGETTPGGKRGGASPIFACGRGGTRAGGAGSDDQNSAPIANSDRKF